MFKNEIRIYTPFLEKDNIDYLITYAKLKNIQREAIQINLDNCSIQRMEQLNESSTLDDVRKIGLYPLYRLLNECPNILMSALGINEMPGIHVTRARKSYNLFCEKFWKLSSDDPLATNKEFTEDERLFSFNDLPECYKKSLGCYYLPYLFIQQIYKSDKYLSGIKKFETYLYGVAYYLDMISGFEMEIAKYAFWDIKEKELHSLPENIRVRRKQIRNNFCKERNSLDAIRMASMNAAMDTYWIRSIGFGTERMELLSNGYTISEHWLATNDDKLYDIANSIKPKKTSEGFGHQLELTRDPELLTHQYWREVDFLSDNFLKYRKDKPKKFQEKIECIEKSILEIEDKLTKYIS